MELGCEFSPLVFWKLYEVLGEEFSNSSPLRNRLSNAGLDDDFLVDVADDYRREYEYRIETTGDYTLTAGHSLFAAWLLSSLTHEGDSAEINNILNTRILETYIATGLGSSPRHPHYSPEIKFWLLTQRGLDSSESIPLRPAFQGLDLDVHMAFSGLQDHVELMKAPNFQWSELAATSILWRISGLIEALAGHKGEGIYDSGLGWAVRYLKRNYGRVLPRMPLHHWAGDWAEVARYRNVLTHVGDYDDLSFTQAIQLVVDPSKRPAVLEVAEHATGLYCAVVVVELSRAETLPGAAWESLAMEFLT